MLRAVLLTLLSLSALTLAIPGGDAGQCNGSVLCCNASHRADSSEGRAALAAHGIDADHLDGSTIIATSCGDDDGLLGIGGGSSCANAPVCCEGNSIGSGLIGIGIGCASIPISI